MAALVKEELGFQGVQGKHPSEHQVPNSDTVTFHQFADSFVVTSWIGALVAQTGLGSLCN